MPIIRTRDISDPLSALEKFIQQSEQVGAGLISVVAGTVQGSPFNVVSLVFEPKNLPQITLQKIAEPTDTDEQRIAAQKQLAARGFTALFFAPVFDAGQQITIAACRSGKAEGLLPPAAPLGTISAPQPRPKAKMASSQLFATDGSHGSFRGSSSTTTGLNGTETTLTDGRVVIEANETLTAVRGSKDFGSKTVTQRRVKQGNRSTVEQANYAWLGRKVPEALLVEDFSGFPSDVPVVTAKATQFGKHDHQDEGTGSELLKVVQTNSDVFGASVKQSRLAATFGVPLSRAGNLLKAYIEVFNPKSGRFARVPIVDVGPGEVQSAELDLTLAVDKFLQTEGSAQVQFRIVV